MGDWNAKIGSQETLGVTGKFGLGIQNEAGQRLIVLPRERIDHSKHPFPTKQEKTLHMGITTWSTWARPNCKPEGKDPWVIESTEGTLRKQNRAEMGENRFGWLTTSPN